MNIVFVCDERMYCVVKCTFVSVVGSALGYVSARCCQILTVRPQGTAPTGMLGLIFASYTMRKYQYLVTR